MLLFEKAEQLFQARVRQNVRGWEWEKRDVPLLVNLH